MIFILVYTPAYRQAGIQWQLIFSIEPRGKYTCHDNILFKFKQLHSTNQFFLLQGEIRFNFGSKVF
jgi:hypothetical protein